MSGWRPQQFSQLVDVTDYVANGSFSSLKENVQTSSEPDFATMVRLVDYNNGWSGPFSYVDESSYHFLRKTKLEPGDVIISNVGANAGTVFQAPDLSSPLTLGPNSVLCRPRDKEKLNHAFLYYFLKSPIGQTLLSGIISGSAQPKFNKTDLRKLPLPVPPIDDQRATAEVLGALDDKIAANTKLAQAAKELARAEFTRLTKTPSTSATLRDVLRLEYGKSLAAKKRVEGDADVFGSGGIVGTHNEPLLPGPGVIVGRKGTAGSVYWAPRAYFPIDTTFYVVPTDPDISLIFCFHLLKSLPLSEMNSDSAVPGLNREEALSTPIRVPAKSEIQHFSIRADRLFSVVQQSDQESKALMSMRDSLLPLLMSGKLRVKDAEKIVEDNL